MTTPGSGDQPQNPGQNSGQGWGQQPPSGPDQPGQTPPAGQQWSAPSGQPQQPGQPQQFGQPGQQPWGAPGAQPQQPPKKSGLARILPIVAGVVAVIVVGFLVRGFLANDPEVGDCTDDSATSVEIVDCDSSDAAYRVVGTVDDVSENQLANDPALCLDKWPSSEAYLVTESDPDKKGTGVCLEPLS